ncbi:MAG: hypothetical protein IKB93_12895 [Clostridia bacterium]|nr:hypothetical protein [Clostridia bacterium]
MKFLKKAFSLMLTILLLIQGFCPGIVYGEEIQNKKLYEYEYGVIEQLGYLAQTEDFDPDTPVSGQDLLDIFKRMSGRDISEIYPGAAYVKQVKFAEVLKVFVTDLGYADVAQRENGYPLGYINQAFEIDLVDGIRFEAGEIVTFRTLAKLIYNSMKIKMMDTTSVSEEYSTYGITNVTYMEERLKLKKIEGIFTGVFSMNDDGCVSTTIDYVKYLAEPKLNLINMVGHYITAYYDIERERITAIVLDNRAEVMTIPADDIVSYKDYVLSYNSGSGLRTVHLNGAHVYKNGSLYPSYTEADFLFSQGNVTLVKKNSNGYASVIINQYDDFVVSGKVEQEYTLYAATAVKEEDRSLVLDPEKNKYIYITDTDGKKLEYSDIVSGDVLSIARSTYAISIIRCNKRINGFKIDMISTDDGFVMYSGEEFYKISDQYFKFLDGSHPVLTDVISIYLNSFGEAAYISVGEREEYKIAYIIQSGYSSKGIKKKLEIKLLTSDNSYNVYECADRLKIEFEDGSIEKYTNMADAYDDIAAYTGVASFKFNEDGKISEILLPLEPPANNAARLDNRLYKFVKNSSVTYRYSAATSSLSYRLFYQLGKTVTFTTPTDLNDHDNYFAYMTNVMSSETDYGSKMTAYTYGKNIYSIRALVLANTDGHKTYASNNSFFVIKKIVNATTPDGEDVKRVYGRTSSSDVVYDVADGGRAIDNMKNVFGGGNYKAEVGDIIRVLTDKRTKLVISAQILYDRSALHPTTGSEGFIVGAKAIYGNFANSNPFKVYRVGQSAFSGAVEPTSGTSDRYIYGWVLEKDGNYLHVTTQDLSKVEYDPSLEYGNGVTEGYITEIHPFGTYAGITVDYTTKVPEITAKNIDTVRDYKHSGSECSRVLIRTSAGTPSWCIVLNY